MDIQPTRRVTAAASSIPGLSPTESVMLYADRLFITHDNSALSDVRLLLSGRYADLDTVTFAGLCSMLGALEAAGELEVSTRPRRGLIRTSEQVVIRQVQAPRDWPLKSPEARLGAWLYRQPDNEAWLDDAIMDTLIPTMSTAPQRSAFEYFVGGLAERGVVEAVKRRAYIFFRISEYQVVDGWAAVLRDMKESTINDSLLCYRILGSDIRRKCRDAWDRSTSSRSDTGTASG